MIDQYFHALNLLVTKLHFLCTDMTGPLTVSPTHENIDVVTAQQQPQPQQQNNHNCSWVETK